MENGIEKKCYKIKKKNFLFVFLIYSIHLFPNDFRTINFNTYQGLPTSEIFQIVQDKTGILWIATDNAMVYFNGYEFVKVKNPLNLDQCFVNVIIDKQNRIYALSLSNNLYQIIHNELKLIHKSLKNTPNFSLLKPIEIDSKHLLIQDNLSLLNFDKLNYRIQKSTIYETEGIHIIHNGLNTNYLAKLRSGNYYKKIKIFDHKLNTIILSNISTNLLQVSDKIYSLDKLGFIIEGENKTIFYSLKENKIYELKLKNISTTFISQKEEIWVGFKGNGVRRYKNILDLIQHKSTSYFNNVTITNIYEDNKNGIWFSSLENGIYYAPNLNIINIYPSDNNDIINCSAINNNSVIVGLSNKKIFEYNLENYSKKYLTSYPYHDKLYDIIYDPNSKRLFAGFILSFCTNNKNWTKFSKDLYTVKKFNNTNDTIFLSSFNGVFYINTYEDKIESLVPDKLNIRSHCVYAKNKNLMIGTIFGLYQSNLKDAWKCKVTPNLINEEVRCIESFRDSLWLIGTMNGLYILDNQFKIKLFLDENSGITSKSIYTIYTESKNRIWLGTKQGLILIDIDSNLCYKIQTFKSEDGLCDDEIIDIYEKNNKIIIVTKKGISIISETNWIKESMSPLISNIIVNDNKPFKEILNYFENDLTIEFITHNISMLGKIQYRYKINKGVWQYTFDRTIRLLSLLPSKYNIQIQSQNEDKTWSESTILKFTIKPKYTDTWWFYTLIAIASILIFGLLFKRYFDRQKEKLKTEQRISDFEKSTLQAQMNPHFIFNSLASIQNFILKNDRDSALKYLSKFSALVRKILNQSRENEISLENEIELIDNYLQIEKLRFEDKFEFIITHNLSNSDLNCKINNLLIQPIVENAVIHGVSKKQGNGLIEIDFKKSENLLTVVVKDNGHGYFPSKVDESNPNKSVGMSITEIRLRLINKMKDNIIIENLMDSNNVIIGTQVKISIIIKE